MRTLIVAMICSLCSCGGAPVAPSSSAPAPAPEPALVHRDTPAPHLAWSAEQHDFTHDGFPAVARGGEVVAVAVRDGDSARGNPNLRIELRDRSDKIVQTIAILKVSEYETVMPEAKPTPELQRRLDAANAELAKLHSLHDLIAMHALEMQPALGKDQPHLAIGDDLDIDWSIDHVHVFRHNEDRSFITLDGLDWLAKPSSSNPQCVNPAFLRNAYHAAMVHVILLDIGYRGTDTCWEPDDQWHVVAW